MAINEIRELTTKTIEVDNCQDCPFVEQDRDGYYCWCSISDDVRTLELDLPKDKVHNECSLKDNEYKVKLK